jgi:hypothetical protein
MQPLSYAERKRMLDKYSGINEKQLDEWEALLIKSSSSGGILNDKDMQRYLEIAERMRLKYV